MREVGLHIWRHSFVLTVAFISASADFEAALAAGNRVVTQYELSNRGGPAGFPSSEVLIFTSLSGPDGARYWVGERRFRMRKPKSTESGHLWADSGTCPELRRAMATLPLALDASRNSAAALNRGGMRMDGFVTAAAAIVDDKSGRKTEVSAAESGGPLLRWWLLTMKESQYCWRPSRRGIQLKALEHLKSDTIANKIQSY